jgi:hypothetical protein
MGEFKDSFVRDSSFVVRHSSQQKRRHSWSSTEWSESETFVDCQLLYLIVIVIEVPINTVIKSRTHYY